MVITIKEDDSRFGVRVAGIIYNSDKSKIFMQKQENNDYYMFPGGRVEIKEDTQTSMERELEEELGIKEEVKLRYIAENFIQFSKGKYHEIGFYFILQIDENKYNYHTGNEYNSKDEEHDGKSVFKWIDIKDLDSYNILPNYIKEKIKSTDLFENKLEHIIYREY